MSFIAELKRRNVFRVAAFYIVASWLIIQVADILLEAMAVPGWGMRLIFIMVLLGFPLALTFSWIYELTSDGIKREKDIDRATSTTPETGRKLDIVTIAAVGLVLAVTFWDRLMPRGSVDDGGQIISEAPVDLSIAVLPFANMSADADNEFFADGLSEELLNALAQIDGLKVAGRTSSFHFKGRNEDLRMIGETLGVAHILEGSVRRQGDQVRITAQLIQASDGFHLWSQTFDRKLEDIFAIQDEISASVATALRITLLGEAQAAEPVPHTLTPETYSRFIAAKARIASRTAENVLAAIEMLKTINQEAPDFGPAHAALGVAALLAWGNDGTLTVDEALPLAKAEITRALTLSPDDDYVYAAKGLLYSSMRNVDPDPANLVESNKAHRRAIELNNENVEAMYWLATNLLQSPEGYTEAEQLLDQALRIDPLARVARGNRINLLIRSGRLDEALSYSLESIALMPNVWFFYTWAANTEFARGRSERAMLWLNQSDTAVTGQHLRVANIKFVTALGLEYSAGVDAALANIREQGDTTTPAAYPKLAAGRYDDALEDFEEAARRDGLSDWIIRVLVTAALAERCDQVLALDYSRELLTAWSEEKVKVNTNTEMLSTWIAYCVTHVGDSQTAERLLRSALAYYQPKHGRFDSSELRLRRIATLALLGEREQAISEFQDYHDAGFGHVMESSTLIPFDRDPRFASLHDNPEFQRILAAIRTRNSERIEALESGKLTVDSPL
jgi:TolB-like protein